MISTEVALIVAVCVFFCGLHYYRSKRVLNTGLIFNAYSILYFGVGIQYYSNEYYGGGFSYELSLLSVLCLVALLAFNLVYILFSGRACEFSGFELSYCPRFDTLFLLVVVALLAEFFIIGVVGPYNYFFVDRLDRFPIMKKYQAVLYLSNLMNIALPFILYRYNLTKSEMDKKLLIFVLCHNFFFAIMLISRSALVYNFLCLFYWLESTGRVKQKTILLGGAVMVFVIFFYKGFLYGVILDKEYESFNPGEFINWIRNSELVLQAGIDSDNLPNNSYVLALKSLVVMSPKEDALSEWFIKEFYSDRVVSGLTYGFSGVIEGYLYLGAVGVFLHFCFVGGLFALIERSKGAVKVALVVCLLFLMFRIFRSEIYNFLKTYSWFYVYQIFFLVMLDHLIRKKGVSKRVGL